MAFTARIGRVPIYCDICREPVATVSEGQLHRAAALTPWRGNASAKLADKITESAHVICCRCEIIAAGKEAAHKGQADGHP